MTDVTRRSRNAPSQIVATTMAFAGLVFTCGALVLLVHDDDPPKPKVISVADAEKSGDPIVELGEMFIEGDLQVPVGAKAVVVNTGVTPHNLTVDGGPRTADIAGEKATELDVSSLPAGTYTVYCSIEGHRAAGMESRLVVG